MNRETDIFVTFILRVIYSVIMFASACVLMYLRRRFESKRIKQALMNMSIWLVALALARIVGTLFDYFLSFGSGFIPLLVSNAFWFYAFVIFAKFALRLRSGETVALLTVSRTETLVEEVERILQENVKKTDDLERSLRKHL